MIRRNAPLLTLTLVLLAGIVPAIAADAGLIEVKGAVEKPAKWTADSLRKQFASEVKTIDYTSRGQPHKATCIPLYTVLHEAGADAQMKMGPDVAPAMKNHALRLAVVVTSVDGYTAAFSLAELLPDMGTTAAWIAFDLDGKRFQEGEGHLRVIVPTDKKPARSVRDIQSINVVDVSK
jgi:hypothetical protein